MLPKTMRVRIAVLSLVFFFYSALAQYEDVLPKNPRVHSTQNVLQGGFGQEIPLDGSCTALDSLYSRNVGSIYIPCEAPANKKNMCTLYSGSSCRDEMVQFDHTHISMFAGYNEAGEKRYVGGLVRSVRCQVIDKVVFVANTNGHASTRTQISCPGEGCRSIDDCEDYFVTARCFSGKCQRTGVRAQPNLSANIEAWDYA